MAQKKTVVYVDGFNLYYGCLKGTPYRWLNILRLCETLLPTHDVIQIKYFTALVSPRPANPDQATRQQTYLRALQTIPNLQIIYGHFLSHEIMMPLALPKTGYAKVIKTEEKGSDVKNIRSTVLVNSQFSISLTDTKGNFTKPAGW